jgi:hypothetical protein
MNTFGLEKLFASCSGKWPACYFISLFWALSFVKEKIIKKKQIYMTNKN